MKTVEELYQDIEPIINNGWYEAALIALEKLVDIYDFAPAHYDLGVLHLNSGNKDKALYHFSKSVALQPENTMYNKTLADYYLSKMESPYDALPVYKRILEIEPDNLEVLLIAGNICISIKKFDDAEFFYKKVLEIDLFNKDARQFLDKLEQKKGSPVNESVESPEVIYNRIQQICTQEESDVMIKELESLIDLYSDFAPAYNDLGVLYSKIGNKEKALGNYQKSVKLQPKNIISQKNLADFWYAEAGQPQKALEIYVKILALNPDDIDALMIAGNINMDIGRFDDAMFFYNRVLGVEPWNSHALDAIAKIEGRERISIPGN